MHKFEQTCCRDLLMVVVQHLRLIVRHSLHDPHPTSLPPSLDPGTSPPTRWGP